jgi:hypothetical protein
MVNLGATLSPAGRLHRGLFVLFGVLVGEEAKMTIRVLKRVNAQ